MRHYLYSIVFIAVLFSSCRTKRNLTYFSDLPDSTTYKTKVLNLAETKIQAGDILSITVNSPSPESNMLFNGGMPLTQSMGTGLQSTSATPAAPAQNGYEVNHSGDVNFPVLGKVQIAGLTKEQAAEKITDLLKGYIKQPVVNVRFLNFRVTVLGEVTRPSTFNVQNDGINILEALGMAGDMTVYGKRENVLVVRQTGETRTMARLNLNNKSVFESPYFNLQQGDVVYVEQDKSKLSATRTAILTSIIVGSVTIISVLLSRLL
ncbi:polysaccharide biosynthesis/export family protein [Mucilaginibacter sp. KACC 22063]|uniref:polysaccharide biosynthesis/export family protein n=1 Tax=Mucilaginibacter sp. KACC 22063 TaxID=3025666 RepID=UPI002366F55A|nr:polysaccharide biosynthesis/export family protein [Mucilaginibacter sp. KACC 22063]WDF57126.1 polysaccharide biosynthesis/export family protein [Mucilaginibacter sp. KACC 22063]